MRDLKAPLAVVCHDAGAANIILEWLRADRPKELRAVMQGPAATLWARSFGVAPTCTSIEEALDGAELLVTGTGWASTVEHDARALARTRKVHSVAVIDHWVNYRERFVREGITVWPDEFWVTDAYALAEATRCFAGQEIRLQENLYLKRELGRIPPLDPSKPAELLYVLEPTRNSWGNDAPGEFQALDFFAANISSLGLPPGTPIRLRPHPSDPPGKYDSWVGSHSALRAIVDDSPDLAIALGRAHWVVGCESFALVLALEARRHVVCTLPPWAPPCRIPHTGLIHLKHAVSPVGT